MATQATSGHSALLDSILKKQGLKTLQPRLQVHKLGQQTALPAGEGKQVRWYIYSRVAGDTATLTEGTNPSEIAFTSTEVSAQVAQYGQFAKYSDLLEYVAKDRLKKLSDLFARAAEQTVEDLNIAALDAGLTTRYVDGETAANDITAAHVITMDEFLRAQVALKVAYVGPHERGHYVAVLHPSCEYDIKSETNVGSWLSVRSNGGPEASDLIRDSLGKQFGIEFIVSDRMTAAANGSGISVKNNYLLGEEVFGNVSIDSKNFMVRSTAPGSGGNADPLAMFGTVGYKLKGYASKVFGSGRGLIIKGATSHS